MSRRIRACALMIAFAPGCSDSRKVAAENDPPEPVSVTVAKAVPEDLSRHLVLAAEFRPFQEIDVHAKVAGYVKTINVDIGDRVQQGQVLAILDIPEMQDDLVRARAVAQRSDSEVQRERDELRRAQSTHEAAHLAYARLAGVLKTRPNLVAQQEIDNALARDRESEAQVSADQAALASAENQLQVSRADEAKAKTLYTYARVTAPLSGVITRRYADTGSMIQAGTASQTQAEPVVRLSQNDLLRLVLPLPETDVPRVHLNDPVQVRVPTLNRSFAGRVARFSGRVQDATRTMETEVDVPNSRLALVPGMYAEATLTLERRNRALAVPLQAVTNAGGNASVLLVNQENRVEDRPVKTGLDTPAGIEIVSGLQLGDLVVVSGRGELKPGDKVRPRIAARDGER